MLKNPYLHLDKTLVTRVQAFLSDEDYRFLKRLKETNGIIQETVAFLVHRIANECRARNITDMTQYEDYERLITSIRFDDGSVRPGGRDTAVLPNEQTTPRPNGGGTTPASSQVAGNASQPTSSKRRTAKGHRTPPGRQGKDSTSPKDGQG